MHSFNYYLRKSLGLGRSTRSRRGRGRSRTGQPEGPETSATGSGAAGGVAAGPEAWRPERPAAGAAGGRRGRSGRRPAGPEAGGTGAAGGRAVWAEAQGTRGAGGVQGRPGLGGARIRTAMRWRGRTFSSMGAAHSRRLARGVRFTLTARARLIERFCTSARPASSTVVAGAIAMIRSSLSATPPAQR
jgi:hypothetical protein